MSGKTWLACVLGILCVLVLSLGTHAQEEKPSDEGKGADFTGKTFEIKEKGKVALLLSFTAGKEVTATTKAEKETDVNLYIYGTDGKEIAKDTSPGPKCELKFTPAHDGKVKFLVRNLGPGVNKVTFAVKVAK